MDFTPLNVTLAIFGISFLVVVHEAGHYLAARAFGMRVLRFSIGLGPPLWKHQPKGSPTIFQICALPLLAYVQIDGMNPTEEIDRDDPALYPNKGVFARIVTIVAGPLANYLAASLMVFALYQVGGWPTIRLTNQAHSIIEDSPAAAAGLEPGDRVVEVEGEPIADGEALQAANTSRGARATRYVVERDGERLELTITPEERDGRVLLGIGLRAERYYHTVGVSEAAVFAIQRPWEASVETIDMLGQKIRERTTEGFVSVVGMTEQLAETAQVGPMAFIYFLAHISIALGLFNLFPIPALDGGRLMFLGYEVITRQRANERVEAAIHTVGLLLLLGFLVFVMVRDVAKLS